MNARTVWRLKAAGRRVLPAGIRRAIGSSLARTRGPWQVAFASPAPQPIDPARTGVLGTGWQDPSIPERQRPVFDALLAQMKAGRAREDFAALAEAVRLTGVHDPRILEVGCSTGWNAEVLEFLLKRPVRYLGVDYSVAMVQSARRRYARHAFVAGDAAALPFASASYDIVVSGSCLLHVAEYGAAIAESRRVSARWCVFHTVPIDVDRPTMALRKGAYGAPVLELVFNEGELLSLFSRAGLAVRRVLPSITLDYLASVVGAAVPTRTYVCECLSV